ncbi:MAG TPA: hypothetical protein DD671_20310, partial [Balneolaceae bacterium]|nr:hypothetical protein [Balneolaceae bacterium]
MINYLYRPTNLRVSSKIVHRGDRVPFKWAGAKNRMFKKYISTGFFPAKQPKIFVDMFAGTGAVGRWIAQNYPNTTVV